VAKIDLELGAIAAVAELAGVLLVERDLATSSARSVPRPSSPACS
jgi:hypothetical protein